MQDSRPVDMAVKWYIAPHDQDFTMPLLITWNFFRGCKHCDISPFCEIQNSFGHFGFLSSNLLVWVNNTWLLEAKNPESANILRWQNHEYRSKYHLLVSRGVPCDKVNADGLPLCRRSFHVLKTSSPYVGSISGLHLLRYSFICQSRQKIKNVQYYQ